MDLNDAECCRPIIRLATELTPLRWVKSGAGTFVSGAVEVGEEQT